MYGVLILFSLFIVAMFFVVKHFLQDRGDDSQGNHYYLTELDTCGASPPCQGQRHFMEVNTRHMELSYVLGHLDEFECRYCDQLPIQKSGMKMGQWGSINTKGMPMSYVWSHLDEFEHTYDDEQAVHRDREI